MWSWRDSNSRPNKQYASFLHAYFAIGFRRRADSKQPTLRLSSEVFVIWSKFPNAYFCLSMPQTRTLQNVTSVRHLVSLLYFGKNANPTMIQIKQQEQTLRCQLKFAARDFRDRAAVLCMLTYPLILLSKPVSPNFWIRLQNYRKKSIQQNIIFHLLLFGACPSFVHYALASLALHFLVQVGLYVTIFLFSNAFPEHTKGVFLQTKRISTAIPHAKKTVFL